MLTLLIAKKNFEKEWRWLKKKDEIAIKKVEKRFASRDKLSNEFVGKVYDVYEAYKLQVPHIATVLEEYFDKPFLDIWFDIPFSKANILSVLLDMQFVGTLMCNNLLKRTVNLEGTSHEQLKFRVYIAILNYDKYKRSRVIRKIVGKGKNIIASKGDKK